MIAQCVLEVGRRQRQVGTHIIYEKAVILLLTTRPRANTNRVSLMVPFRGPVVWYSDDLLLY